VPRRSSRRGHHVIREYGIDPFELARVGDVMTKNVDTLAASMPIDEAVEFFTTAGPRHESYPVVDGTGRVIGMCGRADVLRWTMEGRHKDLSLVDIMSAETLVAVMSTKWSAISPIAWPPPIRGGFPSSAGRMATCWVSSPAGTY